MHCLSVSLSFSFCFFSSLSLSLLCISFFLFQFLCVLLSGIFLSISILCFSHLRSPNPFFLFVFFCCSLFVGGEVCWVLEGLGWGGAHQRATSHYLTLPSFVFFLGGGPKKRPFSCFQTPSFISCFSFVVSFLASFASCLPFFFHQPLFNEASLFS